MSDLQLAGIKRNEAVSSVRTAEGREDPIYPGRERVLLGPSPGRREGAGREPEVSSETVYQDDAEDYECEAESNLSGDETEMTRRTIYVCDLCEKESEELLIREVFLKIPSFMMSNRDFCSIKCLTEYVRKGLDDTGTKVE